MKTTKILTILSLAILFAISSTGNANGVDTRNKQGSAMPSVTFQVSIHLSGLTKDICNPYIIQIIDENGRIVAPAQVFNPSTTKYVFREKTPVTGKTRIAVLMPVSYPQHFICPVDLFTTPDAKNGPFLGGQSYSFELYPVVKDNIRESNDEFNGTKEK